MNLKENLKTKRGDLVKHVKIIDNLEICDPQQMVHLVGQVYSERMYKIVCKLYKIKGNTDQM